MTRCEHLLDSVGENHENYVLVRFAFVTSLCLSRFVHSFDFLFSRRQVATVVVAIVAIDRRRNSIFI